MTDIKPNPTITDLPSPAPSDPLEALSWLGDSVEEIAEGLRARGIKGEQREFDSCPLAKYLQEWWPDACVACGSSWTESDVSRMYTHPDPLESFEILFDDGAFPDLIDNG